jgi:hypothetical protein
VSTYSTNSGTLTTILKQCLQVQVLLSPSHGSWPFNGTGAGLTSLSSTEDYSYFTLRRSPTPSHGATSLFGISCTRQLPASELIDRPADVTRSTVQKAVVVVTDSPQHFGAIKAQLGVVTAAWFAQRYALHQFTRFRRLVVGAYADIGIETLPTSKYCRDSMKACPDYWRTKKARWNITLVFRFASSYMSSNGRLLFSSSALYFNGR